MNLLLHKVAGLCLTALWLRNETLRAGRTLISFNIPMATMAAFWSDARNVTLHLDTAEASSDAEDLLRQLEEPLPDWVRKVIISSHYPKTPLILL